MYKYFIFFVFLMSVACKAQQPTALSEKESSSQETKALLWKISGKDLLKPSYLYGTIHIIGSEDYFLPEGTLGAIDESSKVIFEIDMNDLNDIGKIMPILQKAFMDNNITLKDLLSESDYTMVKDHFAELGLPIFFLEKIKPLFLTAFASGDISPGDLQMGKIKSYEMEFSEMARNSEKATGGLETIDFQLSLFDSIPYADQANMLVESIRSADTEDDQFREIVNIYKAQDIDAMYQMMKQDDGISAFEDILLIRRNISWIPVMEKEMKEAPCFFAVGAGHLAGPKGVIMLLRQEGYKVTPISTQMNP